MQLEEETLKALRRLSPPKRLTHGFGLLSLGIEDGELELGTHLCLWTADQQQVERQVVFTLLIQTFRIHSQTPDGGGDSRQELKPCGKFHF